MHKNEYFYCKVGNIESPLLNGVEFKIQFCSLTFKEINTPHRFSFDNKSEATSTS